MEGKGGREKRGRVLYRMYLDFLVLQLGRVGTQVFDNLYDEIKLVNVIGKAKKSMVLKMGNIGQ